MTNQPVAELIEENLPGLIHPGDGKSGPIPLPLPMFRNSAIPPEQQQRFADEAGLPTFNIAKLTAEALVALLEANGWDLIQHAELDQLRAAAAAPPEGTRIITLHRAKGEPPVLSITVGNTNQVIMPEAAVRVVEGNS